MIRPKPSRHAAGWFTATLLVLQLAAAESKAPTVGLRVSSCSQPFEAALRRMLRIELGTLLEDENRATAETIEVACSAETAEISAHSAASGQVAHNDLRFDAFPSDAAPRAVALAALEALRAVDPALAERLAAQEAEAQANRAGSGPTTSPSSQPPGQPSPERDPETPAESAPLTIAPALPASTSRPVTRVTVGAVARHFVSAPATTLLGGRLELSHRFRVPLDVGLDVEGAMGRQRVKIGTLEAQLLSTSAWLAVRAGGGEWSASAGIGSRAGVAYLQGAPVFGARGHQVTRPVVGALALLRADGALGMVAMAIAGEGGYAVAGAQGLASGAVALRLDGFWLALSVNAGVRLPH